MRLSQTQKGFTLVELLIVLAIIALLVVVLFAALDPVARVMQARDTVRQNHVQAILSGVKRYQTENGGDQLASIAAMTPGEVYMAVNGATKINGCADQNAACETDVGGDANCVNLADLVNEGYLEKMPVSPAGGVKWDDGSQATDSGSGYTLSISESGVLTVRACEREFSENSEIQAVQ